MFSCDWYQLWSNLVCFLCVPSRLSFTIQPGCVWWWSGSIPSESPCAAWLCSPSSADRLQCSSAPIQPSLRGAAQNWILNHKCLTPHSLGWMTDAYVLPLWVTTVLYVLDLPWKALSTRLVFLLFSTGYYGVKIPEHYKLQRWEEAAYAPKLSMENVELIEPVSWFQAMLCAFFYIFFFIIFSVGRCWLEEKGMWFVWVWKNQCRTKTGITYSFVTFILSARVLRSRSEPDF